MTHFRLISNKILWSLINHEFNILIKSAFQLSFQLWYLHHQWYKRYNIFLQMNIWKCKFNVEETVFLEVIVSEQDLCMNSSKMIIIVNWTTLINLKEIQSFMRFVNFYRRFIRNFFKLVKLFTQLTRKDTFFV